jgi:hypothetical protein
MMRTTSVADSVNEITKPVRWGVADDDLAMLVDRVLLVRKNPSKRIGKNKGCLRETVFLSIRSIFAFVPFEGCRHVRLPTAYETATCGEDHRSQATRCRSIWKGFNCAFGSCSPLVTNSTSSPRFKFPYVMSQRETVNRGEVD